MRKVSLMYKDSKGETIRNGAIVQYTMALGKGMGYVMEYKGRQVIKVRNRERFYAMEYFYDENKEFKENHRIEILQNGKKTEAWR